MVLKMARNHYTRPYQWAILHCKGACAGHYIYYYYYSKPPSLSTIYAGTVMVLKYKRFITVTSTKVIPD